MSVESPQFGRLINDLIKAQTHWVHGDVTTARALLKVVGSIALAECNSREPRAPIKE